MSRVLRRAFVLAALGVALAASAWAEPKASLSPADAPAGTYELDPAHTSVVWRVSHMGTSYFVGRFDRAAGSLKIDPKAPQAAFVQISLDAASVSTSVAGFDEKLRGPTFLDAKAHPKITFVTGKVNQQGPTRAFVPGNLTFRGITKPLILDVTWNGVVFSPYTGANALGFSAKGKLKRSDFGLSTLPNVVGDEVELQIETEFLLRPSKPAGKP